MSTTISPATAFSATIMDEAINNFDPIPGSFPGVAPAQRKPLAVVKAKLKTAAHKALFAIVPTYAITRWSEDFSVLPRERSTYPQFLVRIMAACVERLHPYPTPNQAAPSWYAHLDATSSLLPIAPGTQVIILGKCTDTRYRKLINVIVTCDDWQGRNRRTIARGYWGLDKKDA